MIKVKLLKTEILGKLYILETDRDFLGDDCLEFMIDESKLEGFLEIQDKYRELQVELRELYKLHTPRT